MNKKVLATGMAFALLFTSSNVSISDAKTTKTIGFNKTAVVLRVKETETISLKNVSKTDSPKIKWTTSDAKVATVTVNKKSKSKATITAIKKGIATITAKVANKKVTCKVRVKNRTDEKPTEEEGNLTYQSDVTAAMTKSSYWAKLQKDADKVLMDEKAIRTKNQKIMSDPASNMYDLKNMSMTYDTSAADRKKVLAEGMFKDVTDRIGTRKTIYVNGEAFDKTKIDAWFAEMKKNVADADVSGLTQKKYAICTKRADLWMAPNSEPVGWSATDPDDEFMNSSINVNEPFVIDMVTADGKFCHGYSSNCSGWVEADHFAISDEKDTWLAQWDLKSSEVLVVTTSHITLEKSNRDPATSEVDLMLGTQLPLIPRDQLPENIAERGTWYNHVVWLPTRDASGKFVRSPALISSHHNVSVGYLPLTKKNILKVAFSCLGDRYGWGGMLNAMDCSMYTRSIYRCFGLELPRNTTWQRAMPTYKVDFGPMTDKEKKAAISKLPAGALLMFSGHITMYIGEVDGKQYVISDLGSLSETVESIGQEVSAKSRYCVSINSLDVRRASGNTWLTEMLTGLVPWKD